MKYIQLVACNRYRDQERVELYFQWRCAALCGVLSIDMCNVTFIRCYVKEGALRCFTCSLLTAVQCRLVRVQ
jgi:hypothetical protein